MREVPPRSGLATRKEFHSVPVLFLLASLRCGLNKGCFADQTSDDSVNIGLPVKAQFGKTRQKLISTNGLSHIRTSRCHKG